MAICRCALHHSPPIPASYVAFVEPIGYPDTAAICGINACQQPGLVWLDAQEVQSYQSGQRVFYLHTRKIQVKVKDGVTFLRHQFGARQSQGDS